MYTDGLVHDLDWFKTVKEAVEVVPASFEDEKAKGLYFYTGNIQITEDTQQIEYYYYADDNLNEVYDHEIIPVVRDGVKGENGAAAKQYKGAFYNSNIPVGTVEGDTYLNLTNQKLYKFDGSTWVAINDDNDPAWWEALGDAIKYASDTQTNISAANVWAGKIVAGTILTDYLMSKKLVFKDTFQSSNWVGGDNYRATSPGLFMDKNGNAAFNGNSIIRGNLDVMGDYLSTPTINPNITQQILRGGIRAMFYWFNGRIRYKTDNIESISKLDTGTYLVKFKDQTYLSNCFGYSLYSSYSQREEWTVPAAAKSSGKVVKMTYKVGIVTDIEEELNAGYKIIQNYGTKEGTWANELHDFNTHALVFFML